MQTFVNFISRNDVRFCIEVMSLAQMSAFPCILAKKKTWLDSSDKNMYWV